MTDTPDFMLTNEVSALTRVPIETLRYFRGVGKGPTSFRLGRRVIYRRVDVLAWIDEQERVDAARQGM